MTDIAIRVEGLSKRYKIGRAQKRHDTLRDLLVDTIRSPFRKDGDAKESAVWALRDVFFEVPRGEVLGIIGRNGAGKSTLLKILSRITEPTEGWVEIHGRVGSLLEVGTGFHPELTGRENIYLNGAILGMRRVEIDRKFEEIVAFAEIEKFLDTPVKHYSSGMYVRLAFAVAAHLEPEILLIDEVLAVGDVVFQKKCLGKMGDVAREGRTVLFVSHNMSAISSLCDQVLLLEQGAMVVKGPTEVVTERYLSVMSLVRDVKYGERCYQENPSGEDIFVLRAVRTLDRAGRVRSDFTSSELIMVEIEFSLLEPIPNLIIGFWLKRQDGTVVFMSGHNDALEVIDYKSHKDQEFKLRAKIPKGLLNGGIYLVNPFASMHRRKWLVKDTKGVLIQVAFDVPNADYVYSDSRPGYVSPILEWCESE
jgi:lipopolysaccharide transport system ATP-binding protein